MSSMNFYDLLGVSPDAEVSAIEKAFRAISLSRHPDRANAATRPKNGVETPQEREARERRNHELYVKITEARDTLIDARKRKAYDRELGTGTKGPSATSSDKKYPSRSATKDRAKSKSKSKSEKPKRRPTTSSSKAAGVASAESIIEGYLDCLEVELAYIKHMEARTWGMQYTLEHVAARTHDYGSHAEAASLLEGILRKCRKAREGMSDARVGLEFLAERDLSDSKKMSEAMRLYSSAIDGALYYTQRATNTLDELQPLLRALGESTLRY